MKYLSLTLGNNLVKRLHKLQKNNNNNNNDNNNSNKNNDNDNRKSEREIRKKHALSSLGFLKL